MYDDFVTVSRGWNVCSIIKYTRSHVFNFKRRFDLLPRPLQQLQTIILYSVDNNNMPTYNNNNIVTFSPPLCCWFTIVIDGVKDSNRLYNVLWRNSTKSCSLKWVIIIVFSNGYYTYCRKEAFYCCRLLSINYYYWKHFSIIFYIYIYILSTN